MKKSFPTKHHYRLFGFYVVFHVAIWWGEIIKFLLYLTVSHCQPVSDWSLLLIAFSINYCSTFEQLVICHTFFSRPKAESCLFFKAIRLFSRYQLLIFTQPQYFCKQVLKCIPFLLLATISWTISLFLYPASSSLQKSFWFSCLVLPNWCGNFSSPCGSAILLITLWKRIWVT